MNLGAPRAGASGVRRVREILLQPTVHFCLRQEGLACVRAGFSLSPVRDTVAGEVACTELMP